MVINDIQLEVGRPKLHEGKTGQFITFPVYLNLKGMVLILWGFRISRGRLLPPATKTKQGYFDLVEANQELAEALYQTIRSQESEEWKTVLQDGGRLLEEMDRGVEMLLYSEKSVRLAFE